MIKIKDTRAQQINELSIFKELINEIGAYIFTKDINGNYLYANQLVLDLFKCALDDIIGKDDSYFFDLSHSSKLQTNDRLVINQGLTIEEEETNIIKSSGETRIYSTIKKPLRDENGNIIGMCGIASDITEQKQLQEQLKTKNELLDVILNNVDAHIFMKNIDRKFLFVNNKAAELFGIQVKDIIGRKDIDIMSPEVAEIFRASDNKVFNDNIKYMGHETYVARSGKVTHYQTTKVPIKSDQNVPSLIGFSTDVTELYQLKEELKKQATLDDLTGLYNRRYFFDTANREFSRCKRQHICLSLISIDIDFFKKINDTFGHPVGDIVLAAVGKNLLSLMRLEDVIGRVGGEEFLILLADTSIARTKSLAERIRQSQDNLRLTGDWEGVITPRVSIGLAFLSDKDNAIDELIRRADKALYQSKQRGRNQVSYN